MMLVHVALQGVHPDPLARPLVEACERLGAGVLRNRGPHHEVAVAGVQRAPREVDVLEPQEEAGIEAAQLPPYLRAREQAGARRLLHLRHRAGRWVGHRTVSERSGECAQGQRRAERQPRVVAPCAADQPWRHKTG